MSKGELGRDYLCEDEGLDMDCMHWHARGWMIRDIDKETWGGFNLCLMGVLVPKFLDALNTKAVFFVFVYTRGG